MAKPSLHLPEPTQDAVNIEIWSDVSNLTSIVESFHSEYTYKVDAFHHLIGELMSEITSLRSAVSHGILTKSTDDISGIQTSIENVFGAFSVKFDDVKDAVKDDARTRKHMESILSATTDSYFIRASTSIAAVSMIVGGGVFYWKMRRLVKSHYL